MRRSIRTTMIAFGSCLLAGAVYAQGPIGQWDFEDGTLAGTVGLDMDYLDGPGAGTDLATAFGTTTSFGIPDINGTPANVMKTVAAADLSQGYYILITADPSDNGSLVNTYTLIMDILYPAESSGKWRGLFDTDAGILEADAEFFINTGNGIGIDGKYSGVVNPNTWHRIAFVVDGSSNEIRKYIDGALVGTQQAGGLDGRWALTPGGTASLFTDNDGETQVGYVNSIQLWNRALTSPEMAALGAPSAAGIPQTIPSAPSFLESQRPAAGATGASPYPVIEAVLNQGNTTITPASVKLNLDGTDLPATASLNGNKLTISQTITNAMEPKSFHNVSVRYVDSVAGAKTNTWEFTVADYHSITLPEPIYLETFENVEEGSIPAGWSRTNNTTSLFIESDLTVPTSDAYMDWTVLTPETFAIAFQGDDAAERTNAPVILVNDRVLDSIVTGKFAYAESDKRGNNEVQVLFSTDYNLTGKTNVYLSYHSMYEQNQDSIGAVEYSVDQGATWLPVVYMIDASDIIKDSSGNVDAFATLNTARADQAYGMGYGENIGVASNLWSTLAPYLSERIDDDTFDSKRVELFRLPQADNKPAVRLRFLQAGTGSWFFGIDDVGLYSIEQTLPPVIRKQPAGKFVSAGSSVTLQVEAEGNALAYEWRRDGDLIQGATEASFTIPSPTSNDAGIYTVTIKNAGGSVTSEPAELHVFSGPVTQDLVLHLTFDNDLNDTSGRGNNGAPVGSPSFEAGVIGQAAHIPSGFDYITLGRPDDLNFGAETDFSVSFWTQVKEFSSDASFIGNKDWDSGSNKGWIIATDDDAPLQWNMAETDGTRKDYDGPAGTFSTPDWRHVVLTVDRQGYAYTYVDGLLVNERSVALPRINIDTPVDFATNIGQDGSGVYGSSFTDMNFDDLGIWRRVLTPQEVAAIYNKGLAGEDLTKANVGGGQSDLALTLSQSNGQLTLNWQGATGVTLQAAGSLTNPDWQDVNGTTGASTATVPTTGSAGFFRLIKR